MDLPKAHIPDLCSCSEMEADAGLVAGSHHRDEFVVIRSESDAVSNSFSHNAFQQTSSPPHPISFPTFLELFSEDITDLRMQDLPNP